MVLRVTAGQRVEAPAGAEQDGAEQDGGGDEGRGAPDGGRPVVLVLRFRAPGAAVGSLLGFGDGVEVLGPPPVRERMAATARAALAVYEPGAG
jgi:predicted DNA-binding transcriptional regulator YafY